MLFIVLEPISHGNITWKNAYLLFSKFKKNWEPIKATEHLLTNFKTKLELEMWSAIFPSYPRLASAFHTVAGANSTIFDLCRQFFVAKKTFELKEAEIASNSLKRHTFFSFFVLLNNTRFFNLHLVIENFY